MKLFSVSTEAIFAAASRKARPCMSMGWISTAKSGASGVPFNFGAKAAPSRSRLFSSSARD